MSSSKKEQSSEPPLSLMPSLPEDIILDILARLGRRYHRTLSLVSKNFRSLVASHELYVRRSLLGRTECRLYVVLSDGESIYHNPYILCRNANNGHHRRLIPIPWPPNMPHVGSFFTVGSNIYALDRLDRYQHMMPSIDISSRFQTVQLLPWMNGTMSVSVAGVIDGKIYVTGYPKFPSKTAKMVMAVFNTETEVWEYASITQIGRPAGCVVMDGKMYVRDDRNGFVYDPKTSKWEVDETLNLFKWEGGCVVDDVLYYYDNTFWKALRAYDPRVSSWVVVKGLRKLLAESMYSGSTYTGSYGGKLVLFYRRMKGIRCAVVSLERRQHDGISEIWGKIDWCDDVLVRSNDLLVIKTLDVNV